MKPYRGIRNRTVLILLAIIVMSIGCAKRDRDLRPDALAKALKSIETLTSADESWKNDTALIGIMGEDGVSFHAMLFDAWSEGTDNGAVEAYVPTETGSRFDKVSARERGRAYLRLVDTQRALADLEESVETYPASPFLRLEISEARLMSLDMQGAVKSLEKAVSHSDRPVYAYILMEAAHSVLNHYAPALKATRNALKITDNVPYLDYREGRACAALQDYECSIKAYARIEDIHPKSLYQKAQAYSALGNYEKAAEYYKKILELYPAHRSMMTLFAETYINMGKYDEAVKLLRDEIRNKPKNTVAYVLLGNALLLDGKNEQAIEALDKVLAIDTNIPRAHKLRAQALIAAGRIEEAEKELEWLH